MAPGKHRVPTPVRLVAAAAAILTIGGIVIASGTASAANGSLNGAARQAAECGSGQQAVSLTDMLATLRGRHSLRGNDTPDAQNFAERIRDDRPGGRENCDRNGAGKQQDAPGSGAAGSGAQEGDAQQKDTQNKGGRNNGGNKNNGDQNAAAAQFPGRDQAGGPSPKDFVDIKDVQPNVNEPTPGPDASAGTFTSVCGTNQEGHRNSDNFMVAPGKVNGAQHVHDYVGNLSTDAFSDEQSLEAAGTTCARNDKSTYFWPVLRNTKGKGNDANKDGGGLDGNFGQILDPVSVDLEFRGSPTDPVNAMPKNISVIMGDAKAVTNGDANARAAWTCTGFEDRTTTKYPLCPKSSNLVRILDFPSCWDGKNLDSANHRDHIVFPNQDGSCPSSRVAVPQLRMTLTYNQPAGKAFAVDTFPDQRHNPKTDHADFMNLMPDDLMVEAVNCINSGKKC